MWTTYTLEDTKTYLKTRFTTLIPSKEEWEQEKSHVNPMPGLRAMSWREWQFFLIGFISWTWDAFDFFATSLNVSNMAKTFDRPVKDITWGITLVLMLRSVGACFFGYFGDRYGRKWPLIINLACLIVIQIGTGFVNDYKSFLGVRALFGIFMGSMYGLAASTALEGVPLDARSFLSGVFQQGYAFGYLLVVVFQRAIVDNSPKGWRAIFWFSAGPPVLFIAWRMLLPETDQFLQQQLHLENKKTSFLKDAKIAFKKEWLKMIYLVIMMTGFNFSSHGSQDLYPTLLTKQLNYGEDRSTVTNSVANLGALTGGMVMGHFSGFIGRRLSVMICCVLGGALIYPWAYTRNSGINAGVFFLQFMVQGAWGVAPVHLSELSPPEFRAFVVGVSYQLGNLASSASSTIESTIGERFPLYNSDGEKISGVYDYSKVMAIFVGAVFAYLFIVILFGPENRHANFNYVISEEEQKDLIEQGKIMTHRSDEENYNFESKADTYHQDAEVPKA
uniref:MFS transporter n=1 Tax=Cyberlindnera americana TaxID=36016 RepID=A0A5P8N908_9ASCO|nr:MFS transporter [Cyberlindnera americana]